MTITIFKKALAENDDGKAIEVLSKFDINNETVEGGLNSFHLACIRGRDKVVEYLLEGPDIQIDRQTSHGSTALMLAAACGHSSIVVRLLASRALVNISNHDGFTALHFATYKDMPDIVRMLLGAGANLHATSKTDVLDVAVSNGCVNVVRFLLSVGVSGRHSLSIASNNGLTEIVYHLFMAGVEGSIDSRVSDPAILRMASICKGDIPESPFSIRDIFLFAARGGNSDKHRTIIMGAIETGYFSVNQTDETGCTLLHYAAKNRFDSLVDALLNAGANPFVLNATGSYPENSALVDRARIRVSTLLMLVGYSQTINGIYNFFRPECVLTTLPNELLSLVMEYAAGTTIYGSTPIEPRRFRLE